MFDWSSVLLEAGVSVPAGEEQFNILCPFHYDQHTSCSINTSKGVWICFRGCGQGSLKGFVQQYLNLSQDQLEQFLGDHQISIDMDFFGEAVMEPTHLPEVDFPFNQSFVPEWIFSRGFTKGTLKRWGAGVTAENGLAIPIKDIANTDVGWVVRRECGFPKYLYPPDFKKSRVLFGANLVSDSELVCIVEGPLDAMWLNQLGYNAVAILGMSISKKQVDLVQELPSSEVVLCLDNDEAGQIGKEKALTYLGQSVRLTYIDLPSSYKDVQEIKDKKILDTLIQDRNYW